MVQANFEDLDKNVGKRVGGRNRRKLSYCWGVNLLWCKWLPETTGYFPAAFGLFVYTFGIEDKHDTSI